jgi:hypothetical protein
MTDQLRNAARMIGTAGSSRYKPSQLHIPACLQRLLISPACRVFSPKTRFDCGARLFR